MKKLLITSLIFFSIAPQAFADLVLFVSKTCPHCNSLKEELQLKNYYEEFDITEYEFSENIDLYVEMSTEVAYSNGLVPLMIYKNQYFEGQNDIIAFLESDEIIEEDINLLTDEDLLKINEIVKDEKSQTKYQKIIFTVFISIIAILALIVIQKVFQSLRHKKGRGHH